MRGEQSGVEIPDRHDGLERTLGRAARTAVGARIRVNLQPFHASRSIDHQPFRSACYAPFVGLSFDVHGMVSVCAFTRSTPLGRVGEASLVDMWNGASIAGLRASVRADDLSASCARCAEEIAGGNLHGVLAAGFDPFPADEAARWPSRMEFALTNACNLQCIMCSGEFSSAIRSHREGLPPLRSRYDDAFLEELTPFLAHLRQARFLGGEPFLSELNFQIWERMIATGSPAECNVTTNGTQWTPRLEAVLEQLSFSVGMSIDGVSAATVEHIRHGASYDRIMRNLGRFIRYRDRTGNSLSLTFCLMVENVHEFADYLLMAEDLGCQVYVNTVRQPPEHSLYRLPDDELRTIVERLESQREDVAGRLELNRAAWHEQLDRLHGHLRDRARSDSLDLAPNPSHLHLVQRLGDSELSETATIEELSREAVGGRVSVVRCDAEDNIVVGADYVGLEIAGLRGAPSATLFPLAAAAFGHQVDVVAQRIAHGVSARVVAYVADAGRPTTLAMVTRRGPEPYSTTKLAAVLVPGRRAGTSADPEVPVAIGRLQR